MRDVQRAGDDDAMTLRRVDGDARTREGKTRSVGARASRARRGGVNDARRANDQLARVDADGRAARRAFFASGISPWGH